MSDNKKRQADNNDSGPNKKKSKTSDKDEQNKKEEEKEKEVQEDKHKKGDASGEVMDMKDTDLIVVDSRVELNELKCDICFMLMSNPQSMFLNQKESSFSLQTYIFL
jgi:hypothetical protein